MQKLVFVLIFYVTHKNEILILKMKGKWICLKGMLNYFIVKCVKMKNYKMKSKMLSEEHLTKRISKFF